MTERKDASIFPHAPGAYGFGSGEIGGMTLRDYFAAQAISGGAFMLGIFAPAEEATADRKALVATAYGIADAMILERQKP